MQSAKMIAIVLEPEKEPDIAVQWRLAAPRAAPPQDATTICAAPES